MEEVKVLVALGANLGERELTLRSAWECLSKNENIKTIKLSKLYETEPVGGPPNQPMFLNAAGLLETTLTPEELLAALQEVENKHGRERKIHWAARTLDLDIILYENQIVNEPNLTIPHPRLTERKFVLIPANEIAADMIVPTIGKTIGEIYNEYVNPLD
ncbi:MAG: 2-amino-4-hydroxy-6-hydroxymethyldihydropteridine diphosphokinase [Planctomycetaceae bacterium]|nr:2-amino-4-hydroxy-6-hydroxymethyldihydropteridine diphosphokinase [Planctomycetaceae bacterium]